jgi:hypothetical protein
LLPKILTFVPSQADSVVKIAPVSAAVATVLPISNNATSVPAVLVKILRASVALEVASVTHRS